MADTAILLNALRAFGSPKELARAAGCGLHTAYRYRNGETQIDALTLTRLMSKSREIANAVLRMAGLDDLSLDLEQARLLRELAELEIKRARRNHEIQQRLAMVRTTAGRMAEAPNGAHRRAAQQPEAADVLVAGHSEPQAVTEEWDGVERRRPV